jgi:hypothetical protein
VESSALSGDDTPFRNVSKDLKRSLIKLRLDFELLSTNNKKKTFKKQKPNSKNIRRRFEE